MASQADARITAGLRPRTSSAYLATFKLFLAFVIFMDLQLPATMDTIVLYLEYLAQNSLKSCSLRNHISVLKHFFASFGWPVEVFNHRKVQLLIRSVERNARMQIRVKGVFTISLLEKLIKIVEPLKNGQVYKTVFLVAFLRFFRLASLLPSSAKEFQRTRYLTVGDVIWGKAELHLKSHVQKISRTRVNIK